MPRKSKTGKAKTGKGKTNKSSNRHRLSKSRKNISRNRYRGGCEKCTQAAESNLWTNPIVHGGSQINQDIYNYKTDPYFYSSA
jgi:hypothetical protein